MFKLAFSLSVVALGPQVVLAAFKFNFSPAVVQCAPVTVQFSGHDATNHSIPTTLTILPLVNNAVPIQIPIPNGASNSTGIDLSFIPLPANTRFIATLDAAYGPASQVSDITRVLPANDTVGSDTCLSAANVSTTALYNIPTSVSQCESFSVNFAGSPPNISMLDPKGDVTFLPLLQTDTGNGVATYMMTGNRDNEVVLMFDDPTQGPAQNSDLLTIQGDSSSDKSCIPKDNNASNGTSGKLADGTTKNGLPRGAIIGIAIGAAIFVIALMVLLFLFLRRRRRSRRGSNIRFDPARLNTRWSENDDKTEKSWYAYGDEKSEAGLVSLRASSAAGSVVRDPLYTNDEWRESQMIDDDEERSVRTTSMASWNQAVPTELQAESPPPAGPDGLSDNRMSMNTVDIQNILEIATVHRKSTAGPPSLYSQPGSLAKPAIARIVPSRRSSNPPGLPQGMSPLSRTSSLVAAEAKGPARESSTLDETDMNYGYAVGSPVAGGEDPFDYPMPPSLARNSSQRDTSESWGNIIVR